MLLADKELEEREIRAIAVAVYAIVKTVRVLKSCDCTPQPLLRLHLTEGMTRGS